MKKIVFILGLVLFITTIGCIEDKAVLITPEEMQTIIKSDYVQLIDVRSPEEYNEGHIENSQNIDYYSDTFSEDILVLDKTKPVILYCKSGKRSKASSIILLEAGFEKVYDLDGGILEWKDKGLNVIVD